MIEFDTKGLRSNIEIDVMSLHTGGLTKIGTFKTSTIERLTFLPPPPEIFDPNENRPINEMTFNVIVALVSSVFIERNLIKILDLKLKLNKTKLKLERSRPIRTSCSKILLRVYREMIDSKDLALISSMNCRNFMDLNTISFKGLQITDTMIMLRIHGRKF